MIGLSIASTLAEHGAEPVGPFVRLSDAVAGCEQQLDGAILDLILGHEPSTDIARLLRQRKIPFILMTGHDQEMIPAELDHAPRLSKPFEEAVLLDACRSAFA